LKLMEELRLRVLSRERSLMNRAVRFAQRVNLQRIRRLYR